MVSSDPFITALQSKTPAVSAWLPLSKHTRHTAVRYIFAGQRPCANTFSAQKYVAELFFVTVDLPHISFAAVVVAHTDRLFIGRGS